MWESRPRKRGGRGDGWFAAAHGPGGTASRMRRARRVRRCAPRGREPLAGPSRRGGGRQDRPARAPGRSASDFPSCGRSESSPRWSSPSRACISSARRCSTASSGSRSRSATRSASRSGSSAGPAPDRFLVGLAALSLLAEVAEEQPLLCVVDDAQWLDRASAPGAGFVARRLLAEPVGDRVRGARSRATTLSAGLPELVVRGLDDGDARALLSSAVPGRARRARARPDRRRDARQPARAAGAAARADRRRSWRAGSALPSAAASGRIEESFLRRLEPLPDDTRLLLLVAAADPVGDPLLMWRAAERLGIAPRREPRQTPGCWTSARGCVPASRSCGRPSTGPPPSRERRARPPRRWRRPPTATPTPTAAPGTGARRTRPRRGRRGGARALGRPRAGPRRPGRGGRVPGARGRADRRSSAARRARARRRAGQPAGGRVRRGARAAGRRGGRTARRARTRARGPAPGRGRVRAEPRQRRSAAAPSGRQALEPLDARLLATRIWTPGAQRCSPAGWRARAAACSTSPAPSATAPATGAIRRERAICCSTASRWSSPRTRRRSAGAAARASRRSPVPRSPREEVLRWGWLATPAGDFVWDYERCLAIGARAVQLARDSGALEVLAVAANACGQAAAFGGDFAARRC